ncbi:MAG: TonB-dependent receptor [Deltaproteobacteria bacterium]|nr:TonB-dependent receptor [Deltaproteobacteria bacterium]
MFLSSLSISVPGVALSKTVGDQSGVYKLGEVVVTAQRDGVESIATVREITEKDINAQGARTLSEAIALLPGVNIRVGAQGVPRVDMRGLRGRHVILLLDGIPFNSTYDGQFDPSIIGVENIAKIKVSYGNHSVLYGDGGLGGMINIVTKKGKKDIHGKVSGEIGDRQSYLGKISISGTQDNVDFLASGSTYTTDGFGLSDNYDAINYEDGGLRKNSDNERSNLFANVGFTPNKDLQVGLVVNTVKGEYGIPPSTISSKKDDYASSFKYERMEDLEGYSAQLSANYSASNSFRLRGWVFINQLDEEKKAYDDDQYNSMNDVSVKTYEKNNETRIQGINLQGTYDLDSAGSFTLGLSARQDKWGSDGRIRDVQIAKNNYAFRNFDYERENNMYMAALEYTANPIEDLGVVLGYSQNWFAKDSDKNDNGASYLAGLYYDMLTTTRLRGSYARKIRFPSISQLYDGTSGNSDLETEKSNNYELGVIQELPWKTTMELVGFYLDITDYIEKDSGGINRNHDNYLFKGIELTAETRFIDNLILRLGYTFMDTEDQSDGTVVTDLQYRPKHKITLESTYAFDFGLSAYLNIMHTSGQFTYTRKAPTLKKEFNNYTVVNTKISQVVLKDMLSLYVGVDNLFDEDYEESYGFPKEGRYIYGGFELTF